MALTGWLVSVAAFALVMSITPGPNNVLLAASGARSGFVGTLPSLGGILLGMGTMLALSAAGASAVVLASSRLAVVLQVGASAYMLYLAWRLWHAGGPEDPGRAPMSGWWQFALFQFVNPKAWIATASMGAAYLDDAPVGAWLGAGIAVVTFLVVVAVSCSVWILFGRVLALGGARWQRLNRAVAVLAALTVVTFWL